MGLINSHVHSTVSGYCIVRITVQFESPERKDIAVGTNGNFVYHPMPPLIKGLDNIFGCLSSLPLHGAIDYRRFGMILSSEHSLLK